MTQTDNQRYAVARLIGYCEGIIKNGDLGECMEAKLRENLVLVCNEFNMPCPAEPYERELDVVRACMALGGE